jgi:hypothetical protein
VLLRNFTGDDDYRGKLEMSSILRCGPGMSFTRRARKSRRYNSLLIPQTIVKATASQTTSCIGLSAPNFTGTTSRHSLTSRRPSPDGGRGVVVTSCPMCRKKSGTMPQFLDHLTDDVLPAVLDRLSSGKNWMCGTLVASNKQKLRSET